MAKIKWTPQALNDIEAIAKFISRDSDYYARIFAVEVFEIVERLELFPKSGRIVPEINRKEIKEIIFGNYRIIYRVKNTFVEILTVYHSARLFDIKKIKTPL